MMSRLADLAVSTTFAGSLLLANTSCATRHPDGAATSAPRSETQVPGVQRLVQFSFGTQAAFGVCVEPACPAVTPKTLAMAGAAPMQAVAHRVAATADATRESGLPTEIGARAIACAFGSSATRRQSRSSTSSSSSRLHLPN